MAEVELRGKLEQQAAKYFGEYGALAVVKGKAADLLGMIGGGEQRLFCNYTGHDIAHADRMAQPRLTRGSRVSRSRLSVVSPAAPVSILDARAIHRCPSRGPTLRHTVACGTNSRDGRPVAAC